MSKAVAIVAFSCLLCCAALGAPAQAPEPAQPQYVSESGTGIEELLAAMRSNNLELQAARQRLAQAEGRLRQRGLRPNPRLEVDNKANGFSPEAGPRELELALVQPVELGGKRAARVRAGEAEREMTRFGAADLERRLAAELRLRAGEALAAAGRLRALEDAAALQQRMQRAVTLRVSAGDASRLEMALTEAETARLVAERQPVAAELERLLGEIKLLAGLPQTAPLILRDRDLAPAAGPPLQEAALVEKALAARPDLQALRWRATLAEAGLRLAQANAFPDLGMLVGFKQERSAIEVPGLKPAGDWLFRVGASIALPVFNRNQGTRQESAAFVAETRLTAELGEQQVRRDVHVALRRVELATNSLRVVGGRLVPQAENAARIARTGYELGELSLQQLLFEQRRMVEARTAFVDAALEAYRAGVELSRAVGE